MTVKEEAVCWMELSSWWWWKRMSSVPSLYIAGSRTKGSGGEENVGAHVPDLFRKPSGEKREPKAAS
jgi:hypothetical protein